MVAEVNAQRSAQAVMKVSVNVVKTVNVNAAPEKRIILTKSNRSQFSIGSLSMRGMDPNLAIVSLPKEVVVKNKDGRTISLSLKSATESLGRDSDRFVLKGSIQEMEKLPENGTYKGSLVTTIEYL